MRIGLYGESANDLIALKNLFAPIFPRVVFEDLLGGKTRESVADNIPRSISLINKKIKNRHFDALILVRDLDGFATEKQKLAEKQFWFQKVNKATGNISIFLLNIREIEALILADIAVVNKHYKLAVNFAGDPTKKKAKEFLQKETKSHPNPYHESHAPALFAKLDYNRLLSVSYFNEFHGKLTEKVNKKKRKND